MAPTQRLRCPAMPKAKRLQHLKARWQSGKRLEETVSFARDIAPVLKENCNGCHIAGRQASGNFRMDTFAQLLRGGDSGKVIANQKPADSLLVKKLKGEAGLRMPAGIALHCPMRKLS